MARGYEARAGRHEAAAARQASLAGALAQARLWTFAGFVAAGAFAEVRASSALWLVAGALLLGFFALVAQHRAVRRRQRELEQLAALNREGVARMARDWSKLPVRRPPAAAEGFAFATDLDLFEATSLAQLLGPHGSALGDATLDRWLLERAAPDVIAGRQEAVRELAALEDWREQLAVHARRTPRDAGADIERFLTWAEAPLGSGGAVLNLLPWVVPAFIWVPLALSLWIPLPPVWLLGAAAAVVITGTTARRAHAELEKAFGREALFDRFPALFRLLHDAEFQAPTLRGAQQRLRRAGASPTAQLDRLRRIMGFADARFSNAHFLLQLGFLWDLHVLRALLAWKRDCGGHVREWLGAAAEIEALAVLGTLAHDQPTWCFPEVLPGLDRITAESLGHPLIANAARVDNDVVIGPPGTFLLVTGSNMSGKSTLLRAVGLNAVLAQMGAPCCARSLRMPPLAVASSIRVQDSLSLGVSYFMAELQRLKQVVDQADATPHEVLFLLDEILHGTNTAERRIAARSVIAHLVRSGAIGAVTTHDLELATGEELQSRAVPVHFTERFEQQASGEERMTFDYVLRPGIAPSTNALKLMELVGLRP